MITFFTFLPTKQKMKRLPLLVAIKLALNVIETHTDISKLMIINYIILYVYCMKTANKLLRAPTMCGDYLIFLFGRTPLLYSTRKKLNMNSNTDCGCQLFV